MSVARFSLSIFQSCRPMPSATRIWRMKSNFAVSRRLYHIGSNQRPLDLDINRTAHSSPNRPTRSLHTSTSFQHGHIDKPKPGEEIKITFTDKDGDEFHFEVSEGDNLLDIAQANDLEMEGACGGSCACSTCHVIVEDEDMYEKMPEPDDDENDMLDLAFGLTETSRLGCQVKMKKELDGLRVKLPSMTRNLQASDFSGAKK